MKKALYVYVSRSSFVRKDIDIFSKLFKVEEFDFEVKKKSGVVLKFIQQLFFLLTKGFSSSVIICQFSAYHSFLPALFGKLTGKKVVIISGGNDAVAFPSIGYGNFNKPVLKWFTAMSYKLATIILPKHESLWICDYSYADGNPSKQGIKAFVPDLHVKHLEITNGYDENAFKPVAPKSPKTFLTVTGAMQYGFQKHLKGIDLILEVAPKFPDCTFTIIGVVSENDFPDRSPNVKLMTKVDHHLLAALYSQSTFYLQLSMAEGFPNALCEAMLCECVPIGSAVFSIPEIIGDTGFILPKRDPALLEKLLKDALQSDTARLGTLARKRIVERYSLSKRETALRKILEEVI